MNSLISALELHQAQSSKDVIILDCRANLVDRALSLQDYRNGHIENAFFADLESDLSDPTQSNKGRHPLPSSEHWQRTLRAWGVSHGSRIVVYDQNNSMFAARAWWMLKASGLTNVAVLNGGLDAWLTAGFEYSTEMPVAKASTIIVKPFEGLVDEDAVKFREQNTIILDARAMDRYLGKTEPLDAAAGHIPGAVSAAFTANLHSNGTFKSTELLQQRFASLTQNHTIICYCGSGVTACHNLFSLALAGYSNALLFPGSWSQWSSDPANPIETKLEGSL